MRMATTALILALSVTAGTAAAQMYRWTDERGRLLHGDTPPPGARNVEKIGGPSRATDTDTSEPYSLRRARENAPVTLYTTPNCELCGKARNLLNNRGVPFKEISVANEKGAAELKAAVGADAVPSIIVGATVQQGFEEATYHGILDAAGYPKTGVAPPRSQQDPAAPPPKPEPVEERPRGPYAPRS